MSYMMMRKIKTKGMIMKMKMPEQTKGMIMKMKMPEKTTMEVGCKTKGRRITQELPPERKPSWINWR